MKSSNLLGHVLRTVLLCALVGLWSGLANANNIRIIGKPILDKQDTINKTVLIKFDLAWDNSWRTSKPANHDAAWIFVKCWDGESWNHVYLEEDDAVPGSTTASDAVNKGKVTYSVTDREQTVTNMKMVLKPGYSYAWKKWHLDPDEDSVKCVVGFFLYREKYGAGHVVVPGITFKWNYGNQGFVDDDDLVVKVFAIEMVYVPEGPYYLGGKGTVEWQPYSFTTNGNTFGTPMVVKSEDPITVSNTASANTLWAAGDGGITEGKISANFPKGYKAFYIMKYEMTQEAYVEFLNTLNQGQQDGRINGTLSQLVVNTWAWGGDIAMYRNHIRIKQAAPVAVFGMNANGNDIFNETDLVKFDDRDSLVRNIDGQDLAVNFVSMYDLLAYAEFSGLRPMTELEYEKACRGPREPVNDEFAWGSITKVLFTMSFQAGRNNWYAQKNDPGTMNDGITGTESISDAYNCVLTYGYWSNEWTTWWSWNSQHLYYPAPARVGLFADSTSTRAAAGATFWGVMNMSDNVAEMCISVYDTVGRKFEGAHGCGQVDGNGDAINKDWHISDDGRYFIVRGMRRPYWSWSGGGWNHNDRSWTNELCLACGDGSTNNWGWSQDTWVTDGMVSCRRGATMWVSGTERNFTINNDRQRGIRLVRTEDAQR